MQIDQYITVRDIRRVMRLSQSECYRLARRIPGTVKIGRAVRVPLKGFQAYLESLPRPRAHDTGINEIWEHLMNNWDDENKADSGAREQ